MAKAHIHDDGTSCLMGMAQVPASFEPCCEVFDAHTRACVYDVRYEWLAKSCEWGVAISESVGGGYIAIKYCPHCETELNAWMAGSSPAITNWKV